MQLLAHLFLFFNSATGNISDSERDRGDGGGEGGGGRRGGGQGYPGVGRVKGEGGLGGKGVRLPMAIGPVEDDRYTHPKRVKRCRL